MAAAAGGGYVPGMEGQAVSPSVDGAGSPADVSGGGDPGGHQNGGGGGGANYGADINQLLDQVCSLHTAPPIQFGQQRVFPSFLNSSALSDKSCQLRVLKTNRNCEDFGLRIFIALSKVIN